LLSFVYRSIIIDWLERQHQGTPAAVIYLYCSYKEEEVQTPPNMLGSLLKQLVQRRSALPDDVRGLYDKHIRRQTHPTLDELSLLLVQEASAYSLVFVVIDALDECPERGNKRASLLKEVHKLPHNARILVTSRYSSTIQETFGNVPQIEIRATDHDIKQYVETRIGKETSLAKHCRASPALAEEITETIVQNSRGMYVCLPCPAC
jgi:hypothetical protein